jgi:hypothetical protein
LIYGNFEAGVLKMLKIKLVVIACLLVTGSVPSSPAQAAWLQHVEVQHADSVHHLWLDIRLGPPLVNRFNRMAQPADIARVEHVEEIDLLDQVTVGRKLVIFKSVAEAERLVPGVADRIDIIGYNLEHRSISPAAEQANPVGSVQRMHNLAQQHGLTLAFGPDHDFALTHGAAIAPYVDIFVLQVQRVQTQPTTVFDFVLPLTEQLRKANPDLEISVQVRTEGDVDAIVDLIESMQGSLDGVSILTSPDTVQTAEALVTELRIR